MTITSIQSTERAQVIAPAAAAQAASSATTTQDQTATGYYFSPVLKIDPATQSVVIQYRNTQTGAVTNQYPSEKELKAYASQQKFADLESEAGTPKAAPTDTAGQPAPTATVDANAVKPASTFNTAIAVPAQTTPPATPVPAAAAAAASSTNNSIVI